MAQSSALFRSVIVALALALAGCAGVSSRVEGTSVIAAPPGTGSEKQLGNSGLAVGSYVSSPKGLETKSYWIEAPEGLILIDTQLLPSAAREAAELAERSTGKKIVLAIVLHADPDRFNGTAELQKRGIRVVTSRQVLELISEVHEDRAPGLLARFKPDYPERAPRPESFGARTTVLRAGGIELKAHVLSGPGSSEAHVVVEFDGHLFVGDLVANLHHSRLELGEIDEWLDRLTELKSLKPRFVHPGRGQSGSFGLLEQQKAYLKKVVALVRQERRRSKLFTKAAQRRVLEQLRLHFPGYGNESFLDAGLHVEWERQAAD